MAPRPFDSDRPDRLLAIDGTGRDVNLPLAHLTRAREILKTLVAKPCGAGAIAGSPR
jgi:hypothetical protein